MRFSPAGLLPALLLASIVGAQPGPRPDLMATMQSFTQALGVACEYCHSAPRGSGQPEPRKDIARAMMAMTRDVNAKLVSAGVANGTEVTCITCHRGVAIPKQLADILLNTVRSEGVAAAAAQYRDLHARYYGRQAYDFGEETLLNLGQRITASKPDDAITLLQANLEFYPKSARTLAAIAFAYTRKYDDETAIKYYEQAAELDPNNGLIVGPLEQLKSYRRRK